MKAKIITNKGDININLFSEKTPLTVANFSNLASKGFYNNLTFHRVINNFMIQGGCPIGTGVGGPGYQFEDEFVSELKHDSSGILSMANAGPGTNGSQFFITHIPTPHLDGNHTVFGKVCSDDDQKIVDTIAQDDQIQSIEIIGENEFDESVIDRIKEWDAILEKYMI